MIKLPNMKRALQSVRPLLFDHETEDYRGYHLGGSAFAAKYRDRYFIVTASHCVSEDLVGSNAARIQFTQGSDKFLPLDRFSRVVGHDLASWRVDHKKFDINEIEEHFFPLEDHFFAFPSDRNAKILLNKGYPYAKKNIDYGEERPGINLIKHQGCVGRLSLPSDVDGRGEFYLANYVHHESIVDPNGFSGSPVFAGLGQFSEDSLEDTPTCFSGLVSDQVTIMDTPVDRFQCIGPGLIKGFLDGQLHEV